MAPFFMIESAPHEVRNSQDGQAQVGVWGFSNCIQVSHAVTNLYETKFEIWTDFGPAGRLLKISAILL